MTVELLDKVIVSNMATGPEAIVDIYYPLLPPCNQISRTLSQPLVRLCFHGVVNQTLIPEGLGSWLPCPSQATVAILAC